MCQFSVDASLCTRCGLCVKDCVANVIEQDESGLPLMPAEKEELCLKCQHCLAVCPTGAVSVLGKNSTNSKLISEIPIPNFEQMAHLIRSRRSYRFYKDENVDQTMIDSMLKTLAFAPTGCNMQELTFNVIDDKAEMQRISDKVLDMLIEVTSREDFPEHFATLKQMVSYPKEIASYILFRGAPHALIISAPPEAPCAEDDTALATAYFDLLAQSAGLGTVWWGYFNFALAAVPELKSVFGIPEGHAYSAILFGSPDIKYTRTTQKEDAAKIRRVTL